MFHRKIVFVVGAGASAEANLPIGAGLAAAISELLNIPRDWALIGDKHYTFATALQAHCEQANDLTEHLELSRQIARGLQAVASIDKYVDMHRHDSRIAQIAKSAIVHTILQAERNSTFWDAPASQTMSDPLPRLKDSWYFPFGEMIVDGISLEALGSLFENVTIICFNYDRTIEEFLVHWLATAYAIDLSKSRQIVSRLAIVRPYGQVGPLDIVGFGDTSRLSDAFVLSGNIKTFTEQIGDESIVSRIKVATSEAETIAFLGFGFHRQNLAILKPDRPAKLRRILATARGIPPPNAGLIADELKHLFGLQELSVTVDFNSGCSSLFSRFGRALNPLT